MFVRKKERMELVTTGSVYSLGWSTFFSQCPGRVRGIKENSLLESSIIKVWGLRDDEDPPSHNYLHSFPFYQVTLSIRR
jgi:hypothetical protein